MLKWSLLLLSAFLCVQVHAGSQSQGGFGDGEGAVLFHVAQNYPVQMTTLQRTDFFVAVQRTDDAAHETYFLRGNRTGLAAALAYEGSLPAGQYRITDFNSAACSHWCGNGQGQVAPPSDLPGIDVQAGKISYLGTILTSERVDRSTNPPTYDFEWAWHTLPDLTTGRRVLAGAFPDVAASAKDVIVGWQGAHADDSSSGLRKIKSLTGALRLSSSWGKNGFYFASQNGIVKRWRPGEPIEYFDTGSDFAIESVVEPVEGTLIAGGEAGELRASTDGGRSWSDRGASLPFGVIDNLTRLDDGSIVFTIAMPDKVGVFAGSASSGDWRKLVELPMHFSFWTGMGGSMPVMFLREGKLVVTLPSRKFAIVDPTDGATQVFDAPGSISTARYSGDGVFRCSCAKVLAVSPWESRDMGKTWASSDLSRFMALPAFRDAQHGFGFQLGFLSSDKAGISTTVDGGKTWQLHRVAELGITSGTPVYSADGSVMLIDSIQSTGYLSARAVFVYSTDGGEHWEPMPSLRRWVVPGSAIAPGS